MLSAIIEDIIHDFAVENGVSVALVFSVTSWNDLAFGIKNRERESQLWDPIVIVFSIDLE